MPGPARTSSSKKPNRHQGGEAQRGEEETLSWLSGPRSCHLTHGGGGGGGFPAHPRECPPHWQRPSQPAQCRDTDTFPAARSQRPKETSLLLTYSPELTAPGALDPKRGQGFWHPSRPQGHF